MSLSKVVTMARGQVGWIRWAWDKEGCRPRITAIIRQGGEGLSRPSRPRRGAAKRACVLTSEPAA